MPLVFLDIDNTLVETDGTLIRFALEEILESRKAEQALFLLCKDGTEALMEYLLEQGVFEHIVAAGGWNQFIRRIPINLLAPVPLALDYIKYLHSFNIEVRFITSSPLQRAIETLSFLGWETDEQHIIAQCRNRGAKAEAILTFAEQDGVMTKTVRNVSVVGDDPIEDVALPSVLGCSVAWRRRGRDIPPLLNFLPRCKIFDDFGELFHDRLISQIDRPDDRQYRTWMHRS